MRTRTPNSPRRNWYENLTFFFIYIYYLPIGGDSTHSSLQNLAIIPALLHSAILGLLTAAVPLKTIATATLLAIPEGSGDIIIDPTAVEASRATSVHVIGFTTDEELLLAESEGSFSPEEWSKVLKEGERICCQRRGGEDTTMGDGGLETTASIREFIRSAMETKVAADLYWKQR
jgi:exosome complex component RRP46